MKKLSILLIMLIISKFLYSQNYNFSVHSTPYVNLTGSTSISNGVIWDPYSGINATANLGFNFTANGNLIINTLHFSTNVIPTVVYSNQPNPNTGFIYAPFIGDATDRGAVTGTSESNISYKVDGIPGSRIFKLEWSNFGFYDEMASDNISSDFMNIQLWLYEGSNIIEFHYGPSNISNPTQSWGGNPGFGCGLYPDYDFNSGQINGSAYAISGNGNNPSFAYTPNYEVFVNTAPSSGTVYRFSPSNLATSEINTTADVEIFPTIVEDSFQIKTKNGNKVKSVLVYDMSGKLIISKENASEISTEMIPSGIYNVVVVTSFRNKTARIIKK